ncbi:MAG: GldG family protein, partial [Clostridia bacterium]|nr:GldG family protein [Clostridia bacterium]
GLPLRRWVIVSNADKSKFRVLRNDTPPGESDLYRYDEETGEILLLAEQRVTAAILYIINNANPVAWFLQGHGEPEVGSDNYAALARSLESVNYTVKPLDVSRAEEFPAQGDTVIIIKPESDLSKEEYDKLRRFLIEGGRAFMAFAPSTQGNTVTTLPNFEALIGCYGGDIKLTHLQVQEKDTAYYADNTSMIAPAIAPGPLYDALALHGLAALQLPFAQAVEYSRTSSLTTTVTPLLTSSRTSHGKATGDGLLIQPVEQPGDPAGPFTLGVNVVYQPEKPQGALSEKPAEGRMTVLGCADMFLGADLARQGNRTAFVALCNALSQNEQETLVGEKTYSKPALNVPNEKVFNRLAMLVCAGLPLVVLAAGVLVYLRRRHL